MSRNRTIGWMASAGLILVAMACSPSVVATRSPGLQQPIMEATTPPDTTPPASSTLSISTVPAAVGRVPGWSLSLATLAPGGGFTSVSCLSDTFCIAAGGGANQSDASGTTGDGLTQSWDGETWSKMSTYFPAPPTGSSGWAIMPTITCTNGPFCVIVDGSGFVSNGAGTNWITPVALRSAPALAANPSDPGDGHPGSRTAAVSCVSSKFCALVDNRGNAYAWANGSWLTPQAFGTDGRGGNTALYAPGRVGISCPTESACVAVIGTVVLDWNGQTWSKESAPWVSALAPTSGGGSAPNGNSTAISCATSTLCAIVNGSGMSYRNGELTWSPIQTIDPHGTLDAIACPRVSFCMAADANGSIVTFNGATWSAPVKVIPSAINYTGIGTSVSCSSADFCMVINGDGDYATYTGKTAS